MAKHMACREQGMDCDFEITDESEAEMVDFIQIHARSQHDMTVTEDEARDMMESA